MALRLADTPGVLHIAEEAAAVRRMGAIDDPPMQFRSISVWEKLAPWRNLGVEMKF
jgi:hypothetical protein